MKQRTLATFFCDETKKKRKLGTQAVVRKTVDNSKFSTCPLCQKCFPMHILVVHAEACTGKQTHEEHTNQGRNPATPTKVRDDTSIEKKASSRDMPPWWTQQLAQSSSKIENPILFATEPIPGLHLFPNFISEEEEKQIISELDGVSEPHYFLPWKPGSFNGQSSGKRWGVHCNLRDRRVGAAENPLPPFYMNILLPKLQRVEQLKGCLPNEANAIDYYRKKGDWLASHVDDRQLSKEPIANLSLAGDCYMTFINERQKGGETHRVLLPRRTLQVLTGKARYDYSHGIRNQDLLEDRRVSVTMRQSPISKKV